MRSTVAVIDTEKIRNNYRKIKELVYPAAVMAIIKANAYGHGMIECGKILREEGVEFLGVAFTSEAVALREAGDSKPILILVPDCIEDADIICRYNIHTAISTIEYAQALSDAAESLYTMAKVHLYIDTGMSRDGIHPENALEFIENCKKLKGIKIVGLCSHFSSSAGDKEFTEFQYKKFVKMMKSLNEKNHTFQYYHISNTAGIFRFPDTHLSLVRPGISLWGYPATDELAKILPLEPVMTLKSKVMLIRKLEKGETVGYDRMWRAKEDTYIATVPIGYGDGYPKTLTGKAECLISGRRFDIVGTICMDECMVDIGYSKIKVGDEVVLIGKQGKEEITVNELAAKVGTIPYEITTSLSLRIPREYI